LNTSHRYWEIIADNLSKSRLELALRLSRGFSRSNNLVADAHGGDGKRYVVQADEKLTALVELESAIRLDTKSGGYIAWRRVKIQAKRCVMFAVIRHYHFNPKDGAEIDRRIREEFVPIVNMKGFVRYYWRYWQGRGRVRQRL
jgi:hypothetical protein